MSTDQSADPASQPYSLPARPDLGPSATRRVGVLLCHGFTGSPASMRPWADHLAEQGYGVDVPLLPGHGTRWQDLNETGWADWCGEAARALDRVRAEHDLVVVAGLSMGGALALRLAADRPEVVAGLMLVNPAVASSNKQLLALPVMKRVLASVPGIGNDIKKPGVTEHGYDRTPLRALSSMVAGWKELRRDLPQVTAPIRMFRSAVDHIVDPSSARIIQATVSSRDLVTRVLRDSYHVATLDNDAETIFTESRKFVDELAHA